MKKIFSYFLACLCLCMGIGFGFALFELNAMEELKSYFTSNKKLDYLEKDWSYVVEGKSYEVDLPGMLTLPKGTTEVELYNYIPSDVKDGDILRLQIPFGWYDIYIDKKLRASHGNAEVSPRYVIENSSTMLAVKLTEEDASKEICIKKGSIYLYWLVQQKAPSVSSHRDLLMSDIIESSSGLVILTFCLVVIGLLLGIYGIFLFKGRNYIFLLGSGAMLLIFVIYCNTCGYYRFEFSGYSPAIPMSNDFIYYLIQYLIAPIGYIVLINIWKNIVPKTFGYFVLVHGITAMGTIICQMLWIDVLSFMEIILAWMTFIGYSWLFYIIKPYSIKDSRKWFLYVIFMCEISVLMDFYKSVRSIFPLPKNLVEFLQVELPFMIFLPAALVISCIFVIIGSVSMLIEERIALEEEANMLELKAKLAEKEYDSIVETMTMIRRVKHDLNHHLISIRALIGAEKIEEALKYIDSATNRIPRSDILNGNFITNGFVDYYSGICEENDISFKVEVMYNEVDIIDKTDLGIVLGNSFKNAYEGALHASKEKRFVEFIGKKVNNQIVIVVKNGYADELKVDFASNKGENRGLGISSIRSVTEGKGGFFDAKGEDDIFTLKVVMVIKDKI